MKVEIKKSLEILGIPSNSQGVNSGYVRCPLTGPPVTRGPLQGQGPERQRGSCAPLVPRRPPVGRLGSAGLGLGLAGFSQDFDWISGGFRLDSGFGLIWLDLILI